MWHLNEWRDFIDDQICSLLRFNLAHRTLVTQENPSQHSMKMKYLSAGDEQQTVHYAFSQPACIHQRLKHILRKLIDRSNRQVEYKREKKDEQFCCEFKLGKRGRSILLKLMNVIMCKLG